MNNPETLTSPSGAVVASVGLSGDELNISVVADASSPHAPAEVSVILGSLSRAMDAVFGIGEGK